jgi:hypothetical protein
LPAMMSFSAFATWSTTSFGTPRLIGAELDHAVLEAAPEARRASTCPRCTSLAVFV